MFPDIYEGSIWRPPSEAYSLILQPTVGCSWNRCTFCTAFRDRDFRIKSIDEFRSNVDRVHPHYPNARRIFLADGNALCMPAGELVELLEHLYERFDDLERVSIYGGPLDVKRKTDEELEQLFNAGLDIVYIGLESGSDNVLRLVKKGATAADMVEAGVRVRKSGLRFSVIFILGLGGKELSEEHATETARVIGEQDPEYAAALTLMVTPGSDIARDIEQGRITLLSPPEILMELRSVVDRINVSDTVFRANHASNYSPIGGRLPDDRDQILAQIDKILKSGQYKPDLFRAL